MGNKNTINNEIKAEIYINEEDIDKNIRILNSFEENKRELNNDDNKDDYKFQNEKDIQKCTIVIDKNVIPFSFFYKFKKKENILLNILFQII